MNWLQRLTFRIVAVVLVTIGLTALGRLVIEILRQNENRQPNEQVKKQPPEPSTDWA